MGCHSLLQGIFPTQGSNLGLLHGRQILYGVSNQGAAPRLETCGWTLPFSMMLRSTHVACVSVLPTSVVSDILPDG